MEYFSFMIGLPGSALQALQTPTKHYQTVGIEDIICHSIFLLAGLTFLRKASLSKFPPLPVSLCLSCTKSLTLLSLALMFLILMKQMIKITMMESTEMLTRMVGMTSVGLAKIWTS